MPKVTQRSYQAAIEKASGLTHTDDDEDLTLETLAEGGDTVGSTKARTAGATSEVELEDDVETEDDDDLGGDDLEDSKEPLYKKDQVQRIVQTRVNTYAKRVEKLGKYKEAVDRICEVTGLDFDKLATRLGSMSDEEQSKILGVPVEKVKEARQARKDIADERGKNLTLSRQLDETKLKSDPRYSDYDLYKEEIDELLEENPKLSAKQAYVLAKGDTVSVAATRNARQAEIARRVNAQSKSVVKPAASSGDKGPRVDATTVSAAKAVGMDPAEYAMYQGIDNIDAYRAMKAKQKK